MEERSLRSYMFFGYPVLGTSSPSCGFTFVFRTYDMMQIDDHVLDQRMYFQFTIGTNILNPFCVYDILPNYYMPTNVKDSLKGARKKRRWFLASQQA